MVNKDKIICYICNKEIKRHDQELCIGHDKKGQRIYRHNKCKPVWSVKPGISKWLS